jgi:Protein of unknown function (DUF4236)
VSWGFRKSFRLALGVRLNLGRRSAGVSAGPRGAKLSANTSGRGRATLGRRGLFWRREL